MLIKLKMKGKGKYETSEYSPIFNAQYYLEKNPDLRNFFGENRDSLMDHFVKYGMKEGRPSSPSFILEAYKTNNADLRMAFGDNNFEYYMHYTLNGRIEGRMATFEQFE